MTQDEKEFQTRRPWHGGQGAWAAARRALGHFRGVDRVSRLWRRAKGTPVNAGARFVHETAIDGVRLRIDRGPQVIEIRLPQDRGDPGFVDWDTIDQTPWEFEFEPELHATPLDALRASPPGAARSKMLSAALLSQKGKQFDDGLYAAIELAAQEGAGALQASSRS